MMRTTSGLALLMASMAAFSAEPAATAPADAAKAAEATKPKAPGGDVLMSGLSILGNDETPKELVIVPWKSSQLADAPGISRLLDDSTQPVDKDVFLRELAYHEFSTSSPEGD